MPLSYGLHTAEGGVLFITIFGSLSGHALVELVGNVLGNPLYQVSTRRVWDAREVSELVVEFHEVHGLRKLLAEQTGQVCGKTAIVVRREIDRMAAHLCRAYIAERPVEVFTDMDEALRWVKSRE